jgi:hypothetical protein
MKSVSIISVTNVTENTSRNTFVVNFAYKGIIVPTVTKRILTNFLDTSSCLQ